MTRILAKLLILLAFNHVAFGQIVVAEPIIEDSTIRVGEFYINYKTPREYTVGPIRVIGADQFDHNAIKLIAGIREGQKITIPGQAISDAIKNLWKEEIFSNAAIYVEKEVAGIVSLVIELAPRNKLSKFKFVGVNRREVDKIREEIELYSGKTISENLIKQTESKIRGFFREKGHYNVQVNIKRTIDTLVNNSEIFTIFIEKGQKVKIQSINLIDNEEIKDWKLRSAMKDTKQKALWRFFKRSKFTEAAYERDKLALMSKYNSRGLRDAKILRDSVYQINDKNIAIDLYIDEGEKYYFGDISWVGNTKFRSSFLDTILGIKRGDIYNSELLQQRLFMSQDGRDISSLYMDRGYLFFQVIPVETDVDSNYINYEMRIVEGKEARVRRVIIAGNTKTNDYVIRREIRTKPGDLFNRNDIIRSQRELAQLGYFNDQAFQVNPLPNPQDGTVDIEYVVEEKSSDQIELSGGYGGANAATGRPMIIGTLGLTFNNFSAKKLFNGEAWTPLPAGDGQRLSIRGQTTGRFFNSLNFSFTEPWMGGRKPNSLTVYYSQTGISRTGTIRRLDPDYSGIRISQLGVVFGRRKKFPDDYFSESFDLSYSYYDSKNYTLFENFSTGIANDIALTYTLQRNSISAPIYPQSGSQLTFSATSTAPYSMFEDVDYTQQTTQQNFKFLEYYKFKLTGEWFLPMSKDQKLVLRTRVGFAYLGAYNSDRGLSPFGRYFMGGSGLTGVNQIGGREVISLRGYRPEDLSSSVGDPLANKFVVELRYPISLNPQATFFVLGFAEAGNTYPSFARYNPFNVKKSAGIGLRVFLPMFGMIGVDYGWGFDGLDTWATGFNNTNDILRRTQGYKGEFTFSLGMNIGDL